MVLLEVVCGRKNVDPSLHESDFHLLRTLQKQAEEDRLVDIVESVDESMQSDREEILRMIKVAAWCLQDDPERRPLMSTIVKVLEGVMEVDANLVYKFSHSLIASPFKSYSKLGRKAIEEDYNIQSKMGEFTLIKQME
ncbi:unnamed protein product [Dovyalis caffra]|uniref:Uncharacterized protein n=1 Tax=Dovyalis caffra TaxID=77055 RepID=A0AAV1SKW0_9ROSI|nr:unnamed protein product [Dovyalis caffra]